MIKCNAPNNFNNECVIDMDALQTLGGNICCDVAEDNEFCREDILKQCPYSEATNIKDAVIQELYT